MAAIDIENDPSKRASNAINPLAAKAPNVDYGQAAGFQVGQQQKPKPVASPALVQRSQQSPSSEAVAAPVAAPAAAPTDPRPEPGPMVIDGVKYGPAPTKSLNPLAALTSAYGAVINKLTPSIGVSAEERLAANRAELNNDTSPSATPTQVKAPVAPAAANGIASPPAPATAPASPAVSPAAGRDPSGIITAESAMAAQGNPMARSGGIAGTTDMASVNDILARENKTRAEMFAMQNPNAGKVSVLQSDEAAKTERDNAEKTARWGMQDLASSLKGKGRSGNAIAQIIAAGINGQNNLAAEQMRQQTAAAGQGVQARGQDITAQMDAAKIAGTPAEQQLKQAQAQGIMAQTESSKALADIHKKALAGDQQAASVYRSLTGKGASDRYLTVQGGEEIGPDGMTKIKRPGGVFDSQTQKFVPMDGAASGQPGKPAAPQVGEVRGGYKFKGGNPADQNAWEKA